jgi:hypothetical protein
MRPGSSTCSSELTTRHGRWYMLHFLADGDRIRYDLNRKTRAVFRELWQRENQGGARRLALLTLMALSLWLITAFIFYTSCLDRVYHCNL